MKCISLIVACGFLIPLSAQTQPGQVPRAMHIPMKDLPVVRVGAQAGDIIGADNRVPQAAVDYVAGLGGGTVEIGEGTYLMRDSLHLRSNVTVRGQGEKTVLKKAPAAVSALATDGDYGEEQVAVADAERFQVGDGVALWDKNAGGFATTVARISGKRGNTFSITVPLNSDLMVTENAQADTVCPVISGYNLVGAVVENLSVDGSRDENPALNGCRGGGIFLYRAFGTVIRNAHVRNYNGDGISFQQSNDVRVEHCVSEGNAVLGLHPGSGSQRAVIENCIARNNGSDGLYLCWRVRNGVFANNELTGNGGHGISIGHKDTDNLLRNNVVRANAKNGVFFRDEKEPMAGHRNRLEENRIEDNGSEGIYVNGETDGVVIRGNVISDTRPGSARTQRVAIRLGENARTVVIDGNRIAADKEVEDQRRVSK